jgi:hypothetical protein
MRNCFRDFVIFWVNTEIMSLRKSRVYSVSVGENLIKKNYIHMININGG